MQQRAQRIASGSRRPAQANGTGQLHPPVDTGQRASFKQRATYTGSGSGWSTGSVQLARRRRRRRRRRLLAVSAEASRDTARPCSPRGSPSGSGVGSGQAARLERGPWRRSVDPLWVSFAHCGWHQAGQRQGQPVPEDPRGAAAVLRPPFWRSIPPSAFPMTVPNRDVTGPRLLHGVAFGCCTFALAPALRQLHWILPPHSTQLGSIKEAFMEEVAADLGIGRFQDT
uniref:Uncharacterized protein LOC110223712 isoform X2 n=1 Tax=Phascolarctos cinereus TaxID=38626 RepID=A0A6P5M5A8_PHACI|nr:uncharacterized protein LOC110223712 isoform X2 [Phascolarctos cinereus]